MDASDQVLVEDVILAFVAILGILILFLGFRFLLPFRFLRRPRRLLVERLGPLSLLLCALWTITLVPGFDDHLLRLRERCRRSALEYRDQ
jgi:hypothetical protein